MRHKSDLEIVKKVIVSDIEVDNSGGEPIYHRSIEIFGDDGSKASFVLTSMAEESLKLFGDNGMEFVKAGKEEE